MENNRLNIESFKLFFIKELNVMLGKNKANWWILYTMFFVTILSISFSKSSIDYLEKKMNDPFINWVNVQNRDDAPISRLIVVMSEPNKLKEISSRFGLHNFEENIYRNLNFITANNKIKPFEGRTIKPSSPILNRILSNDNLIEGRNLVMNPKSIGLIVTKDMLIRMGYNYTPLFIHIAYPYDTEKALIVNDLNLKKSFDYFGSPIPIVAVVKQLPGMMSFLCSEFFVQQKDNQENTFDLTKDEYLKTLEYANVGNSFSKEKFESYLRTITKKSFRIDESTEVNSYKDYELMRINFDSISNHEIGVLSGKIEKYFGTLNIFRVCSYNTTNHEITLPTDYLSIDFQRLDSIKSFAKWANEECGIKIDMTQIDAKNNFNIISRLGNSLSVAIVLISIAFIVIFLINLLRSHFEKVKKNIGTFKAFGMPNNWLIIIYMAVLSVMILTAIISALLSSLLIEFFSTSLSLTNEGAPIFNVFSNITFYSILATILISLTAIYFTVSKLFRSTPGDLIYERD